MNDMFAEMMNQLETIDENINNAPSFDEEEDQEEDPGLSNSKTRHSQ